MKTKHILLCLLLSFSFYLLSSQVPQGFNYQAIARDGSGNPLTNTTLQVKLTIQGDSLGTLVYWEELHNPVTTNAFGLFTTILGKGVRQATSTVATFSNINWSVIPVFLSTRIFYQSTWKDMGTTRLWSVPYAVTSGNFAGPVKKLEVTGETTNMDEALFEVRNRTGQTVFAVYNEGVRIYVDDGLAKGTKGGFAVGGFGSAKGPSQSFFVVSPDSIRAYIGTNPAKGTKGGFAVGGFSAAKAQEEEYLRVTRDSTRVYVREPIKGQKGGFAVGGFSAAKTDASNYLDLTPNNYFIGHHAGTSITTGLYNSFIGFEAGYFNTTGANNSFIGYQAGKANQTGTANTFLGNSAGTSNLTGEANTFIGTLAGQYLTSGTGNTFMGVQAGYNFLNGNNNVFIGSAAGAGYQFPIGTVGGQNNVAVGTGSGFRLTTGNSNIFLGNYSGVFNTAGSNNVFIGFQSGWKNSSGDYNTFLGYQSGLNNSTGFHNVFLGYQSGLTNLTGTYNLFIGDQAGYLNTIGFNNTFLGYQAGYTNADGNWNVFIGNRAGYFNNSGVQNVFIGDGAGYNNLGGSQNVFLGLQAGAANTTGGGNVFMGWNAGLKNTGGSCNAFFGLGAGYYNSTAGYNTFMGFSAGLVNQTGQLNTYLGSNAGRSNIAGSNNVIIGESAAYFASSGDFNTIIGNGTGYNLVGGSGNVFIGSNAGSIETNVSNKLYIENSSVGSTGALIYGDFGTNYLRLNATTDITGNVAIGKTTPATKLDIAGGNWIVAGSSEGDFRIGDGTYRLKIGVATGGGGAGDVRMTAMGGTNRMILGGNGVDVLVVTSSNVVPYFDNSYTLGASSNRWSTIYAANGTISTSDARLKSNIRDIDYGLESILKLQPVSFTWKDDSHNTVRLGLIAQDVEKVINEVVDKGNDQAQILGINYSELIPVLIKGIQEQQEQIESAKLENQLLKSELQSLKEKMVKIENQVTRKGEK